MNTKVFIIAGLIGGVINWLLGWLFYRILLINFFPKPEASTRAMIFIVLGCITYGFFIAYYFKWKKITTVVNGAKEGFGIGMITGFISNFFNMGMLSEMTIIMIEIDLLIALIITIIVGSVIGGVIGILDKTKLHYEDKV